MYISGLSSVTEKIRSIFGHPEFHSGMPLREAFNLGLVVVLATLLENVNNDNKRYTMVHIEKDYIGNHWYTTSTL